MAKRPPKPTTKQNVINPYVTVRSMQVADDGSGAPAMLEYNGYIFTYDMLGELKCSFLGRTPANRMSRIEARIARGVTLHAYVTLLERYVDEDWRANNARMYDVNS